MATIEGGLGSMVSTKETTEMERAVAALALELPGEVWDDVCARWHAARDSLGSRLEKVREAVDLLTEDQLSPAGRMLLTGVLKSEG